MRAFDLLDDSFPHGTVAGYFAGCKGRMCPAAITCSSVHMRYSGDLTFRRRLDGGMTLTQILEADAQDAEAEKLAERAARAKPKPTPPPKVTRPRAHPKPKAKPAPKAPAALRPHGTIASYRRGCKVESECPGTPTCSEAAREEQRRLYRARNPNARPRRSQYQDPNRPTHGTEEGYWKLNCYRDSDCPSTPSCAQVHLGEVPPAAPVPLSRENKPAAAPRGGSLPRRPHGTMAGYVRGCKDPNTCPNVADGGISCLEAHRDYHRDYNRARRAAGVTAAEGHHGTPYGYSLGCKTDGTCPATEGTTCRQAQRTAEIANRRARGIPARELVDAAPARAHLLELGQHLSPAEIARRAGIPYKGVLRLLNGRDHGERRGELPAHTDRHIADRILAVTHTNPNELSA